MHHLVSDNVRYAVLEVAHWTTVHYGCTVDHCSDFYASYFLLDILIVLVLPCDCGVLPVCLEYDGGVLFLQLFITTGLVFAVIVLILLTFSKLMQCLPKNPTSEHGSPLAPFQLWSFTNGAVYVKQYVVLTAWSIQGPVSWSRVTLRAITRSTGRS